MNKIEVGQTVYVSMNSMFRKTEPNLSEYEVVKVSSTSFYAFKKDSKRSRYIETRFNGKTMTHEDGMGFQKKAYLTEKEYWDLIEVKKVKEELKKTIEDSLNDLDVDKLRKISELIKSR
ncbi:beta barrel domain-containing protein [Priestia megaterium]|uniref:beta barrel domain-containing protein n=1 Tax=Priestia megaterium TaxID=1404 RepID=UPI0028777C2B|nr:hypothetical protein [Priestia megaterium]